MKGNTDFMIKSHSKLHLPQLRQYTTSKYIIYRKFFHLN